MLNDAIYLSLLRANQIDGYKLFNRIVKYEEPNDDEYYITDLSACTVDVELIFRNSPGLVCLRSDWWQIFVMYLDTRNALTRSINRKNAPSWISIESPSAFRERIIFQRKSTSSANNAAARHWFITSIEIWSSRSRCNCLPASSEKKSFVFSFFFFRSLLRDFAQRNSII